jgi:uroporphyrinogen-III decarboxylase
MEYKAGMDMPKLFERFGDKLVYFGNIDMRVLETNDLDVIENELHAKILPVIRNGGRYILHSDHSISPIVEYETFIRYLDMARNISV